MILEELVSRIRWLEQQLNEAINNKRNAENERTECGNVIDYLKKFQSEMENELGEAYNVHVQRSNKVKAPKFKREYQEHVKQILYGSSASNGFDAISEAVRNMQKQYQDSDDQVSHFKRVIRDIEDQLSTVRLQLRQQESENE